MTIELTEEKETRFRELITQHAKAEAEFVDADVKTKALKEKAESLNDQVIIAARELFALQEPTPIEELAAKKKEKRRELPDEKAPPVGTRGTRIVIARAAWDALSDDARRTIKAHTKTAGAEVSESATGDVVLSVVPPTEAGAAVLEQVKKLGLEVQIEGVGTAEEAKAKPEGVRIVIPGAAIEKVAADAWQRWVKFCDEHGVLMDLLDAGGRITMPLSNKAAVTMSLLSLARELKLEIETTRCELAADADEPRALPAPFDPEERAQRTPFLVVSRPAEDAPWSVHYEGDDKEEAIREFNLAWKSVAKVKGEARRYAHGKLKRKFPSEKKADDADGGLPPEDRF